MEKRCSKCKKYKSLDEFHKYKNGKYGVHHYCKECNSNWKKEHYKYNQINQIELVYKVDYEFILNLYNLQEGKCKICNTYFDIISLSKRKGLYIDHCHKTNIVRGLLCVSCNTALGKFKDDINLLNKAIDYLQSHIID